MKNNRVIVLITALLLLVAGYVLAADDSSSIEFSFSDTAGKLIDGSIQWTWTNPNNQESVISADAQGKMLIVFSSPGVYHAASTMIIKGTRYSLENCPRRSKMTTRTG